MSQQESTCDSLEAQASSQDCGRAKGTCPVCYESGLRLTLSGRLYTHGTRNARCAGVGQLPLQSAVLNVNNSVANRVSLSQQSASQSSSTAQLSSIIIPSSSTLTHPTNSHLHNYLNETLPPMIKWIPRAARHHCSSLLTKLTMSVVNKPKETERWDKLLAFGRSILHRPPKGKTNRNLTNIIARRCSEFASNPP